MNIFVINKGKVCGLFINIHKKKKLSEMLFKHASKKNN